MSDFTDFITGAVRKLCPNAKQQYLEAFKNCEDAFLSVGIVTPLRAAHFLAQALHETGRLTVLRENMRYTAPARIMEIFGVGKHSAAITDAEAKALAGDAQALAERVYGLGNPKKAKELGNTQSGDGYRYRGGGLLQTTGRAAYAQWGAKIGADLEGNPDLITDPRYALLPALLEWKAGGCNAMADADDIERITRKINGGLNGLSERKDLLAQAKTLLNGGGRSRPDPDAFRTVETDPN